MAASPPILLQKGSGSIRSLHAHRNEGLEVISVERGTLIWHVEGRSHVVKPGSIFFTLPWQTHGSVFEFEPGHYWDFVVMRLEMSDPSRPGPFAFPPDLGFSRSESRRICRLLREETRHVFPATSELTRAVSALARLSPDLGPRGLRRQAALATLVLVGLADLLEEAPPYPSESADTHRVAKVIDLLRSDPSRPWTLREAAEHTALRKSRFSELFLRETGDTLIGFLNRLRVERARQLLRKTELPITTIALECGFATSQYFAKVFRQFTGVPASRFRISR